MARLIWTLQSVQDLENIYEYISRDSIRYARIHIIRIRDRVKILKKHPKSGRIVPEVSDETLRELIMGTYRIIYRVKTKNLVEIITIHHSAKRLRFD
jgi:toxin ParE1/3/4